MMGNGPDEGLLLAVGRAGTALGLSELLSLRDMAEAAAANGRAVELATAISQQATASALWACSALLEFHGDSAGALRFLQSIPELPWGDSRAQRWLAIARLRAGLREPGAD